MESKTPGRPMAVDKQVGCGSKRAEIAAMIMGGIIANPQLCRKYSAAPSDKVPMKHVQLCTYALEVADELMNQDKA